VIIECPNCETRYSIPDGAFPAAGRPVKCARCKTTWHATAREESAAPEPQSEPEVEQEAAPQSTAEEPADTAPDAASADPPEDSEATEFEDVAKAFGTAEDGFEGEAETEDGAFGFVGSGPDDEGNAPDGSGFPQPKRRIIVRKARTSNKAMTRAFALGLCCAVIGSLLYFRTAIVRAVPQANAVYALIGLEVNLRGLAFRDVRVERQPAGARAIYRIEGVIENVTRQTVLIPPLRLALRDMTGQELYIWNDVVGATMLGPNAVLPFETTLEAGPVEATDISVRFTDETPRQLGLRR